MPHPPDNPDLEPSHFHLFGPLKEGLLAQHFVVNAVIDAVIKWFATAGREFYPRVLHALGHC